PPPTSTLFPYTTLFRSSCHRRAPENPPGVAMRGVFLHTMLRQKVLRLSERFRAGSSTAAQSLSRSSRPKQYFPGMRRPRNEEGRSEEHTSELQSLRHLV